MPPLKYYLMVLLAALSSCIGEDVVDDELIPQTLTISASESALEVGQQVQLMSLFTNEFGQTETANITWSSSDAQIISVDDLGTAEALSPGQVVITAQAENAQSNMLLLTAVGDPDAVASVTITISSLTLQINESTQLVAEARNLNGDLITGMAVVWRSDDEQVATIDANGNVEGLANGTAQITATIDGIESNPLAVAVGDNQRVGTFSGSSGYIAEGTATLSVDDNGDLILELSDDFNTDFALGTYIYLSNSTTGAGTRNNGLEVSEITSDGAATFNVSNIDSGVSLNEFRYVVVLCKPASITFGLADLEP